MYVDDSVRMRHACDALVIGAGPSGASAAIFLAQSGWHVTLVEQHAFPRQKVCGECVAAGNIALLDELGVGQAFREVAGEALVQVGWMRADTTVSAAMPGCADGTARFGRALGRDVLDTLLLERARAAGVHILQPARIRRVCGSAGNFECQIEYPKDSRTALDCMRPTAIRASIIVDAHGSWGPGPLFNLSDDRERRAPRRAADLFAFKTTFVNSRLMPGFLPVVSMKGGYGGLVLADRLRTTVALCLRRDALGKLRLSSHGRSAGMAVESYLRGSSRAVRDALQGAAREGPWLAVGPLRPGVRLPTTPGVFAVGNAAGEAHPLIGEGITMALQSSKLLAGILLRHVDRAAIAVEACAAHHAYTRAWREAFLPRLRLAALFAHVAMNAQLASAATASLRAWPGVLTGVARLASKGRPAVDLETVLGERS